MHEAAKPRPTLVAAALCSLALALAVTVGAAPRTAGDHDGFQDVVVRTADGAAGVAQAVTALGGTVGARLGIIGGFAASVPAAALDAVQAIPGVTAVSPNRPVRFHQLLPVGDDSGGAEPLPGDPGSMSVLTSITGAQQLWSRGITGKGIGVALIDTGTVPVNGLRNVVHGPDLSYEANVPTMATRDTYGHGTHMAGLIVGRDDAVVAGRESDAANFVGMAPDARLISVKAAGKDGSTDVSQVIAAIDWVVQHRHVHNIRVLNLAFGTDGVQDYRVDPLAHAVEVAWRKGIVVVAAAGNEGFGSPALNNPAYDPYVIAVGADDPKGTPSTRDDVIPAFSSTGDHVRNPDLVAPGKSVIGLRAPGSTIDNDHPGGRVGTRFFRGSGTSQSAAIVSGAAALLLQQNPALTPDNVKGMLRQGAVRLHHINPYIQGQGLLDVERASRVNPKSTPVQTWEQSRGTGSLELARGSVHVQDTLGNVLEGEIDAFGSRWDGATWAAASAAGATWSGASWSGRTWSGASWSGRTWSGASWSGRSWSGASWSNSGWE